MTMENSSSSHSGDDYKANNNIGGDNTAPLRRLAHSFMTNHDEDIPQRKREHTILASSGEDVMGGEEDLRLSPQQLLPSTAPTSTSPLTPPPLQSRIPHIISRHSLSTPSHDRRRRQQQQEEIIHHRERANTCPHHHHSYTSTTLRSTLYHEKEEEGEGGHEGSSCDVESGIRHLHFDNYQLLLLSSSSSLGDQQRHDNIGMVGRAENSSSLSSLSPPNDSIIDFSDSSSTQPIETINGRAAPIIRRSDDLVLSTTTTPLSYSHYLLNNHTHTIRHVVQNLQQRLECLGLIKLCMIISLFVLLDIAWVSDLRYKYHSADVNFVLGEYWHGGISNRIVVSPGGKLFNDDVAVDNVGGGGGGILNFGSHTTTSLDTTTTTNTILSSLSFSGAIGGNKERTTLIPPSLSYARSSTLSSYGSMNSVLSLSLSTSDVEGSTSSSTTPSSSSSSSSSDLKSLLPTPKKRTLTLDKFGRRVHDLTDDGTAKYNRMDATSTQAMKAEEEEGRDEIRKKNKRSDKEQAMLASSAVFRATAAAGSIISNTKTLLPQGKSVSRGIKENVASSTSAAPALSQMLDMLNDGSVVKSKKARAADASSADFRIISRPGGSDLKALLPRQNTRFLKLDKFGRRIQKMQDDGTVNVTKEPTTTTTTSATTRSEIEWGRPTTIGNTNYGSLKNLAPTKRERWTRLDFKGGSIIDERRTPAMISKLSEVVLSTTKGEGGSNLKALLPKRSTWTMLDFKGGQIEDFRRTRGVDSSSSGIVSLNDNKPYTNLKLLLPPRTITWRKNSQLLSSGSAPIMSSNVRGLQVDIQDKITSDTSLSDDEINVVNDDDDDDEEEMDVTNKFTNLKDLLPEKRSASRTVL